MKEGIGMEYKYTEQGQVVTDCQKLVEGKYLVTPVMESENGDVEWEGAAIYYAGKLFDKPPTQKLDKDIAKLLEDKKELQKTIRERLEEITSLRQQKWEMEKENEKFFKELEMSPNLESLKHFLNGKITHIVIFHHRNILDFKVETVKNFGNLEDLFSIKLLYLGVQNNDRKLIKNNLRWMLSDYYDGSGSSSQVIPCLSMDDARKKIRSIVIDEFNKNKPDEIDKVDLDILVKKYEINLPDTIMDELEIANISYRKRVLDVKKREVEKWIKNTKKAQEEVSVLESLD